MLNVTHLAKGTYAVRSVLLGLALAMAGLATAPAAIANAEAAPAVGTIEDPWRRTPHGWELVNRWNRPLASDSTVIPLRLDSHPAVLALAQSLAIVAAFALFPPRKG